MKIKNASIHRKQRQRAKEGEKNETHHKSSVVLKDLRDDEPFLAQTVFLQSFIKIILLKISLINIFFLQFQSNLKSIILRKIVASFSINRITWKQLTQKPIDKS